MTTIKPPGPGVPHGSTDSSSASAPSSTGETSAVPSPVGAAATSDAIAALSARVEAGQLKMAQAVDALVERQLEGAGKLLTPEQTAELRALLQDAVASDPTLLALSTMS